MKAIEDIAEEIKGLSPTERLRLAADLMDAAAQRGGSERLLRLAKQLIDRTAVELGAVLCLRRTRP
jgi:hypothetical protein